MEKKDLVLFEEQSKPQIGIIKAQKAKKRLVFTMSGKEMELSENRLTDVGEVTVGAEVEKFLASLFESAEKEKLSLDQSLLWEQVKDEEKEYAIETLSTLYFGEASTLYKLSVFLSLNEDRTYFKRNSSGFIPRSESGVSELLAVRDVQLLQQKKLQSFREFLRTAKKLSQEEKAEYKDFIRLLEQAASDGELSPKQWKEIDQLLEEIPTEGRSRQERIFNLLISLGVLTARSNPVVIRYNPPRYTQDAAFSLESDDPYTGTRVDMTHLHTFTVDDESTRDMDDAVSFEPTETGCRIGVHITDVASFISKGSPLDLEALKRSSTLYLPEAVYPMLVPEISERDLSLRAGELRRALTIFLTVDKSFQIQSKEIIPTTIRIREKLSYESGDEKVSRQEPVFSNLYRFISTNEQLRLLNGANSFHRSEPSVRIDSEGIVTLVDYDESTPARTIIAELAIIANQSFAQYGRDKSLYLAYRTQGPPLEIDGEIQSMPRSETSLKAKPHSGLGLDCYLQATSPLRRYLDLVNQRQILASLSGREADYSKNEMAEIIQAVQETTATVNAVSKLSRRLWLLRYLEQKGAARAEATVMRTDGKFPLLQLNETSLFVPVRGLENIKPGRVIEVKITALDALSDYLRVEAV